MSHAVAFFAFCWDFGEVTRTKQQTRAATVPHAQRCWEFLPRLIPQGQEWISNGPSEVLVNLTWLKFAARVGSFYTIVPCRLPEMPRKMKEAMDLKAIEEAMKQRVPERMARIIAMPPGSRCGAFRKRKDGTKVKDKEKPTRSRPCYKPPRPLKEAMEPKAIEDAMSKMRPRAKARFIALTPGSQYGFFRKRKDGTIQSSWPIRSTVGQSKSLA